MGNIPHSREGQGEKMCLFESKEGVCCSRIGMTKDGERTREHGLAAEFLRQMREIDATWQRHDNPCKTPYIDLS
jgi:hypothetical protein